MSEADNRTVRRQRTLKDGKIVIGNDRSVVDCTIRDLSDTGAKLRCGDQTAVPHEFFLYVPQMKTLRACRAVWRRDDDIGIRFSGPELPAPAWAAKLTGGRVLNKVQPPTFSSHVLKRHRTLSPQPTKNGQ